MKRRKFHARRRIAAALAICLPLICGCTTHSPESDQLETLETTFAGKIGLYAVNSGNGEIIAHRAEERFPLQSTIKFTGVAALLKQSSTNEELMREVVRYSSSDLLPWSPITRKNIATGMTREALAEAAISASDNAAMNLIMAKLGGPAALTQFARSIGNQTYHVDHYEGQLNSDPSSETDTSTPHDMALSVQKLLLGNELTPPQQEQLIGWMRNNTVGYQRMRAGVPIGWIVADKTGSGDYGVANDIGIAWSPYCKPIVLAIYTAQHHPDAPRREDIIASATKIVLNQFAQHDPCFAELSAS